MINISLKTRISSLFSPVTFYDARNECACKRDPFTCCLFPWSTSPSIHYFDGNDDNIDTLEELTRCMKEAILAHSQQEGDNQILSHQFTSALLDEPDSDWKSVSGVEGNETTNHERYDYDYNGDVDYEDNAIMLKGLPHRPFYKEISKRICYLQNYYNTHSSKIAGAKFSIASSNLPRPLIPADKLGFEERILAEEARLILLPHNEISISNCMAWLESLGENGIRELLGLRNTAGSEPGYFPPDYQSLIQAARMPCRPNSNPPHLTVAGKARAKHAHRGEKDQFFGVCNGSTQKKNDAAEDIVKGILKDAVWINIHVFGGIKHPVIEFRNKLGYGARWRADWDESGTPQKPTNVIFRGFLEPQMEDGFERKWRH